MRVIIQEVALLRATAPDNQRFVHTLPTIDAVEVVRCKDCKHRGSPYSCPMRKLVMPFSGPGAFEDCTTDDSFCSSGERKEAEK